MANKYEIGSPIRSSHLDTVNSEALFVVTRRDLLRLELEILRWEESLEEDLLSNAHPELFFHFDNYPIMTAFGNLEKAKKFLEKGKTWYENYPDGQRFWVEVKSIKS